MRCWGINRNLRRCKNKTTLLFCWQHKLYWWSLIVIAGVVAGLYQDLLNPFLGAIGIGDHLTPTEEAQLERLLSEAADYLGGAEATTAIYRPTTDPQALELARRRIAEALTLDPSSEKAHLLYGLYFYGRGQTAEAQKQFDKVLDLNPKNFEAYLSLGCMAGDAGNLDEAIRLFWAAVKLSPNSSTAFVNLGSALSRKYLSKDLLFSTKTEREIDKQISEDGTSIPYSGGLRRAVWSYTRAISCCANDAAAYLQLANLLRRVNEYGHAEKVLRSAIVGEVGDYTFHCQLGELLLQQNRRDEAIEVYSQGAEKFSDSPAAVFNFAKSLEEAGDIESAIITYRSVIAKDAQFEPALVNLGAILWQRGVFDEAEDLLRRAIDLDPYDLSAFFHLGIVLSYQKKPAEARQAFQTCWEIGPLSQRSRFSNVAVEAPLLLVAWCRTANEGEVKLEKDKEGQWNVQFLKR
jgi:tetratricopeptide (TPR) repeat protein